MPVYAVANPAPASGKTTTAIALATYLGVFGARVLLVDCDPHGDLTHAVGGRIDTDLDLAFQREVPLTSAVTSSWLAGVDVLTAGPTLALMRRQYDDARTEERFQEILLAVAPGYAYTLVDCPSNLGPGTRGALSAGSALLAPVPCESDALPDLAGLMRIAGEIRGRANPDLRVALIATMDDGTPSAQQVLADLRSAYRGLVLKTVIPYDGSLDDVLDGRSILSEHTPGANAYQQLMTEIAARASRSTTPARHAAGA